MVSDSPGLTATGAGLTNNLAEYPTKEVQATRGTGYKTYDKPPQKYRLPQLQQATANMPQQASPIQAQSNI